MKNLLQQHWLCSEIVDLGHITVMKGQVKIAMSPFFDIKQRSSRHFLYNPATRRFWNERKYKWVLNPIDRRRRSSSNKQRLFIPEVDHRVRQCTISDEQYEGVCYVLKLIAWRQMLKDYLATTDNRPRTETADDYSWLPSRLYVILIGDGYRGVMRQLVSVGVLEEKIIRNTKGRFPLFRFRDPYVLEHATMVPVSLESTERKTRRYIKWKKANMPSIDIRIIRQMAESFPRIAISSDEWAALWRRRFLTKYLKSNPCAPLSEKQYMRLAMVGWWLISRWNSADVDEKLMLSTRCGFGKRLHHIYTYLPSELRAYAADADGRRARMTEFDLANSQPAFFANLLVNNHAVSRNNRFVQQVESATLYSEIAKHTGCSREAAKSEFFHYLYATANGGAQQMLETLYPEAGEVAKRYKSIDHHEDGRPIPKSRQHREFSRVMQREESRVFTNIRRVLLNHGFKFIPIHDAVYVANLSQKQKGYVRRLIEGELNKHFSIRTKIRFKRIYPL